MDAQPADAAGARCATTARGASARPRATAPTSARAFNAAPITFPRTDGVNAFNDLTPRFGAAYDVFGNGKTAHQVQHRALSGAGDERQPVHAEQPGADDARSSPPCPRTWSDDNGNFAVDCDILNPAAQSGQARDTCGSVTGNNLNFGKTGNNIALGQSGGAARLGRPAERLAVGRQPAAGADRRASRSTSATTAATSDWREGRAARARSPTTSSSVRRTTQPWTINAPSDPRLPERRRLSDYDLRDDGGGVRSRRAELHHARHGLRSGAHRLLARRRT